MKRIGYWMAAAGFAVLLLGAVPPPLSAEEYSLEDLCRIALARSEKLRAAEESLAIAEIGKDKALSYLLPRMTASGGLTHYSEKKISSTGSLIQPDRAASWGIRVEESFSLSGRELTALEMSKQNVEKSRFDLAAVREDYLLRQVAASFYNVLMARKNLEIAEANLERLGRYRDAAEKRLKIGEVTRTALLRAEGELSGARSDRLQAENGLELAIAVLASNCGIEGPFTLRNAPPADAALPELAAFEAEAFRERAEIRSLEIQKRLASDQVRFNEGAFWPSLSLSAAYAGADQHPASSNLNRESLFGAVALNFPFFEGGLRKAEVAEARARERQATLYYEEIRKAVGVEVRTAYLDLETQKGILAFLDDQLAFARDNFNAVTRQFDFGLSTSLDVMDANTLLVSAERKAAAAAYGYQLALLRMKRATGTLLPALAAN